MTKKASTLLFKENNRVTLGPPDKGTWYAALCQSGAGMADQPPPKNIPQRLR